VAWILRLVKTGAEVGDPGTDLMEISRPDGLGDIANLGLTLSEGKQLLANVQREIVAAQVRTHVVRRQDCPRCAGVCHVKDYREHAVATLFGQVTMKLPRFRCARCGGIETGIGWPSHCRSTPELDRLRAHLSALIQREFPRLCRGGSRSLTFPGVGPGYQSVKLRSVSQQSTLMGAR
jgi:transposase